MIYEGDRFERTQNDFSNTTHKNVIAWLLNQLKGAKLTVINDYNHEGEMSQIKILNGYYQDQTIHVLREDLNNPQYFTKIER